MFRENIIRLRSIRGWSQERVSSALGISRQAYAKWESGESVPDIEKCALLASVYAVSLDSLVGESGVEGISGIPPAPNGKNIWGSVTLSELGQIVIPRKAREKMGFTAGMKLVVLSDENGIALVEKERFEASMRQALKLASMDI